jgi:hypothetical protein
LNCCGLKSKLNYPEFHEFVNTFDILCFVESKIDDLDEIVLPGFLIKMKNRKSFSNRKSGGIVLGFKEEYDSFIHPIPTDSSYVFWFRISRELFGLDEDVVCGIVYIPPEYTVYSSVDAFSELENEYLALQRNYKYIFLNGDFNSRTGKDPDFIYIENNNDNIDFFELSDVNSVNILESLNIPVGRINKDKCQKSLW